MSKMKSGVNTCYETREEVFWKLCTLQLRSVVLPSDSCVGKKSLRSHVSGMKWMG